MTNKHQKKYQYSYPMLFQYFLLAFGLTWVILIPVLSFVPENQQVLFFVPAAFGPFFAAIITMWTHKGWMELGRWLRRIFTFRIPVILYLAGAFFFPIGMGILHYVLYRVLGGYHDFSGITIWYLYLLYLIPTALLTGGNEEPGWRGFALPALLERFHPILAGVILGIIHATWHLPIMRHYDTTFYWYIFNIIPLTCILNWFYLKSRGSIVPVMLLHAGTNVIGDFLPTLADVLGGLGTFMVLRGVVYWGIAIVLIIVTKGRLGYNPARNDWPSR
jgi:membrane protease YdiL (CAAX protease family)